MGLIDAIKRLFSSGTRAGSAVTKSAARSAEHLAAEGVEKTGEMAHKVAGTASGAAHKIAEETEEIIDRAADKLDQVANRYEQKAGDLAEEE